MRVINGQEENEMLKRPVGVGLGNFDGLHIGHMALINTLIKESKLNCLDSMLYTFTKHPENILRKKLFTPLLTTVSKKNELLAETVIDAIYYDEFDESFSRLKPEEFVKNILVKKLNVKLAVAGFDYRFGYKGEGDVRLLQELGQKYHFKVIIIPQIKIENQVVSSTLIRQCVAKGDMDCVFKLLGRHYSITAIVESGKKIGSTLGFPTANIYPEAYLILPCNGVYITKTFIDGRMLSSITNIGFNPTFQGVEKVSVETHILDFNDDIYGKRIEVFFISKIRGERRFKSRENLIHQIKEDIQSTKKYFNDID